MIFDHLSIGVVDLAQAAAFYDGSLNALGYVQLFKNERAVSYGPEGFKGEAPFTIIDIISALKQATKAEQRVLYLQV